MLLGAPLLDSKVDFMLFVATIQVVKVILSKKLKFLPCKKKVSLLAPLFDLRIDFKVFVGKIKRC